MGLAEFLQGIGQGFSRYGQYQYQKKRADQDDAFEQARIQQANDQLRAAEQNRLRDEANTSARDASRSLEQAGIYGAGPALNALAATQGNRVQGQASAGGAMQDYVGSALSSLKQASDAGISDDKVTDLGEGRYFVPPDLGKPERPQPYGPEYLAAMTALIQARGAEARKTQAVKPQSLSAQNTATNLRDRMLNQDIDRYVAEAGGDPNKAMTRYFQQKGMGSMESPEEAAQFSDLGTRFNAAGTKYRNSASSTTVSPNGRSVTVRGDVPIPWSALSHSEKRDIAMQAGVQPDSTGRVASTPANVAKVKAFIRSNRPDLDPDR